MLLLPPPSVSLRLLTRATFLRPILSTHSSSSPSIGCIGSLFAFGSALIASRFRQVELHHVQTLAGKVCCLSLLWERFNKPKAMDSCMYLTFLTSFSKFFTTLQHGRPIYPISEKQPFHF